MAIYTLYIVSKSNFTVVFQTVYFIAALILTLRIDMSSAAPISSVPPQSVAPTVNKPGNVSYANNPMFGKPAVKQAGMFDWLFPIQKQPLLSWLNQK